MLPAWPLIHYSSCLFVFFFLLTFRAEIVQQWIARCHDAVTPGGQAESSYHSIYPQVSESHLKKKTNQEKQKTNRNRPRNTHTSPPPPLAVHSRRKRVKRLKIKTNLFIINKHRTRSRYLIKGKVRGGDWTREKRTFSVQIYVNAPFDWYPLIICVIIPSGKINREDCVKVIFL